MNRFFKSRLYRAIILILLIILLGVLGYMIISGYGFVDALYMTVITITTVGFGEVHPFTNADKLFSVFLILTSISVVGYTVSSFSEYLVTGQLFQHFKHKKVEKKIAGLKNHTIVCGYGRNGKQAITKLKNYKKDFVVVEKNKEIIQKLDAEGVLNIEGDATTDETMLRAGINNAQNLITALPSDADNLFVVLTASQLNKKCKIISRASKETSYNKLKIA
ncbi:MAG: potassium channel family protein, partial [Flavobacteriaceae bacterium]